MSHHVGLCRHREDRLNASPLRLDYLVSVCTLHLIMKTFPALTLDLFLKSNSLQCLSSLSLFFLNFSLTLAHLCQNTLSFTSDLSVSVGFEGIFFRMFSLCNYFNDFTSGFARATKIETFFFSKTNWVFVSWLLNLHLPACGNTCIMGTSW